MLQKWRRGEKQHDNSRSLHKTKNVAEDGESSGGALLILVLETIVTIFIFIMFFRFVRAVGKKKQVSLNASTLVTRRRAEMSIP